MNFSDDMKGIMTRNSNLLQLFEKAKKPKVTVTQCPRITAMMLADEHKMTLSFGDFGANALVKGKSAWISYTENEDHKDTMVRAIHRCLDQAGIKY